MIKKYKSSIIIGVVLYITFLLFDIIVEYLFQKGIPIFKPAMLLILMLLYWKTSFQKNNLFFIIITALVLSNLFSIYNSQNRVFYCSVLFLLHEIVLAYYIIKLTKLKDFYPLLIAIIPFIFVFFFLFEVSNEIPDETLYLLVLQYNLISFIGSIVLSNYMTSNTKKHKKLLFFGCLFIGLNLIDFIQKYWIPTINTTSYNIVTFILNAIMYYLFYNWVLEIEKESPITENLNYN